MCRDKVLEELILFTKRFLWSWKTDDTEFIREFQTWLITEAKKYKKCKIVEVISVSFTNEILSDFYSKAKEWIKTPKIETFITLKEIREEKINDLLIEKRRESRYTWIGEKRKELFERNKKDFIQEAERQEIIPPPTSEDRKNSEAIEFLKDEWGMLSLFCNRISEAGGIKVKINVDKLRAYFESDYKKRAQEFITDITKAKSVYETSKELGVDYRKLIYTLRSIKFPLLQTTRGRSANLIRYKDSNLFEQVFPLIKTMWKCEENYRGWVELFKKERGWSKSRISKFMMRRIKDKSIPPYFFDVVPSVFNNPVLFSNIIKKDEGLRELFQDLERALTVKESDLRFFSHLELKKYLVSRIETATKTILSVKT